MYVELEKRLIKDIRRQKLLLVDAQKTISSLRLDATSRSAIKQLRSRVEELEVERDALEKWKRTRSAEGAELEASMKELAASRAELDERCVSLMREKSEVTTRFEDSEVELAGLLSKYRLLVEQRSQEQTSYLELEKELQAAQNERDQLKSTVLFRFISFSYFVWLFCLLLIACVLIVYD